ncbi:carbohydrate kinase family protein [Fodinicola acaciae]|uniref:carbohydrate kinase family protein n=1 Tax=Fodinicola acaciae TaxID=2681555 RepID=UPI0013D3C11C|nr:carbohydrate kinase [Fodinicola acaciae]
MSSPVIAVIGENIVDLVPAGDGLLQPILGGSGANTAVAAARLGTPTALLARIGSDAFGRQIRERLASDGVDGRFLVQAAQPSSLAVVSFDDQRRASYDFWVTGTADWQWQPGELPEKLPDSVRALLIGSIAALQPPGAAAIAAFAQRVAGPVTLAFDPNLRPSIVGTGPEVTATVERLVGMSQLVKVSDEDLDHLYPSRDPSAAVAQWAASGPALVVLTRGGDGAEAVAGDEHISVAAPKIELVDTVGAGDSFAGTLLHGLAGAGALGPGLSRALAESGLADAVGPAVRAAVVAAALTCTREGADPPTAAELATALTRYPQNRS